MLYRSLILLPLVAAALAGCKPENKFQPPPPAEISVAKPLQQKVQPFMELTGNTVAFNTVDLVARVEGFLTAINYTDGAFVKKGDLLFLIEPTMYQAKVKQAQAELDSAKAQLVNAAGRVHPPGDAAAPERHGAEHLRPGQGQAQFGAANVENQDANLTIAQTNLGYTRVTAPFDGVVTKPSDLGRRAGRQRRRDQARHHRPARSDLRRIQHERAGRAQHPRQPQAPA